MNFYREVQNTFAGRGLDKLWFTFCVLHIPISLALDLQGLYPSWLLAETPFPGFLKWYLDFSKDPILGGAIYGGKEWDWLKCFIWMEGVFQVPCFIIGAIGLWRNDKRVYPILLAYGASTATTLIPTLSALFTTDLTPPLTPVELAMLLNSYVPFLLLPLGMALDMGRKIIKLIDVAQAKKAI